jgi:excinuclease ABC subunit B
MAQSAVLEIKGYNPNHINIKTTDDMLIASEPEMKYDTIPKIEKAIAQTKKQMDKFAKALDFMEAAKLRDEMFRLETQLQKMKNN